MNRDLTRVRNRVVAGYSVAGIGMGLATTAFYVYFLYFLTTVAGLDPAIGGVIIMLAVLWDGITDPGVGFLSDRSRSRFGKRRPFILAGAIPFGVFTALMFTNVSFVSGTAKLVWVLGINMAFWLFFTMCDIPWATLGSELTEDFNEKTRIRTASSFAVQLGMFTGFAAIPLLEGYGDGVFGSESAGWSFAGGITGLVVVIAYLISWNATRGREPGGSHATESAPDRQNIFRQFGRIVKNRPMRYLLALTLLMVMALSGVWSATLMFLLEFNLGVVEEARQSMFLSVWGIAAIVLTPFVGVVSTRFSNTLGKAKTLGYASLVTLATLIVVKIVGLTPTTMVFLLIGIAVGHSAFWLLVYVLAYDVGTVETYISGEDKDGLIVSVMSFTLKLGMALGLGLGGILLSYYGFDETAATQSTEALAGIETIFFVWGGGFILAGAIFSLLFPITRKKYEAIKEATEKRANGEDYSEEAFADLL